MSDSYPIILRAPEGSTVRIDRFPLVLGRFTPGAPAQPDCDLTAFDPAGRVALQHAVIEWRDGRLYATDLGSETGTVVNGMQAAPHQPVEIGPYGVVAMGSVPVQVEVEGVMHPGAAPPPPPPAPPPPAPAPPPPPPFPVAAVSPTTPESPPVSGTIAPPPPLDAMTAPWPSAEQPAPAPEPEPSPEPQQPPAAAVEAEPEPAPAASDPAGSMVAALIDALDDPEVSDIRAEMGQVPLLRVAGRWETLGELPLDAELWSSFWESLCRRTGIDPASSGYVSRAVDGALNVEAVLPPPRVRITRS